ncbi:MAG: tripartite tricarboxylate transporter TctB family protein [Deltaproteobacteria bacterium]|nr:tripartite tricarboxylate transporter TctB family protein [Deltaproteobacteria bacterium]
MKNPDQTSSLFWLVVGIGIALGSLRYGFGDFLSPGAGFITFFAGAILSLLSICLFIASVRRREPRKGLGKLWEGREVGKVFYVILLLTVYTLSLKFLGFLIATFLLLVLLFRIKAAYRLLKIVLIALLITAGTYLVFQVWLKVQLPKGLLQGII